MVNSFGVSVEDTCLSARLVLMVHDGSVGGRLRRNVVRCREISHRMLRGKACHSPCRMRPVRLAGGHREGVFLMRRLLK